MEPSRLRASVIIPAAGLSRRMSSVVGSKAVIKGFCKKKPFILLGGRPMAGYVLDVFRKIKFVKEIILAVNKKDIKAAKNCFGAVSKIIEGGLTRSESVYNGIKALDRKSDIVLIHDAARPFITEDVIIRLVRAVFKFGAAVAAVPAISTIKRVDADGFVASTLNRKLLWEIQTPQVFRRDIIVGAYCDTFLHSDNITDDAMLVEKSGRRVKLVMGSCRNIKITTPDDLKIAEAILAARSSDKIQSTK